MFPRLPSPARAVRAVLLLAGLAVASFSPARLGAQLPEMVSEEEILSYDVRVEIQADGWLDITEEIQVRAEGQEIRRGIYRDFPTRFPGAAWYERIHAPFEVTEVLRDGEPEPYVLQSVGGPSRRGGVRVRVGDPDIFLDPGAYTYTLRYRTTRWIRYGSGRDTLTWNATGNGWDFPILEASARLVLPTTVPADSVTLEGWTGPVGSTESELTADYRLEGPSGRSEAVFRTTARLGSQEGLTVRLAVPAGVVAPPTAEERARWFRLDWGPWLDAGLVVVLVLTVYLLLWNRVGRDPEVGPMVVRYRPPEDFSPAAVGYLMDRGYETRQMAAAMVSLAVKGWITLERDGEEWVVRGITGDAPDRSDETASPPGRPEPLTPEEERLLHELLGDDGRGVEWVGSSSNSRVRAAAHGFRTRLKRTLEHRYFVNNRRWFGVGLLVTLVGFGALAWRVRFSIEMEAWFLGFWLTIWSLGTSTLVARAFVGWRTVFQGSPSAWGPAVFITLFSIPFVTAEVIVAGMLFTMVPPHLAGAAIVLGVVNVLFYHLLERPTLLGRGVLDQVKGYLAFLTAAEGDRIRRLQPAEASLTLFERHLPYALALGVESEWAERFEDALAVHETTGPGTTPGWYVGGNTSSVASLGSSLGRGLASTLSSASAAPSSSSGGSSGGSSSSGGGGGGGGGGGW